MTPTPILEKRPELSTTHSVDFKGELQQPEPWTLEKVGSLSFSAFVIALWAYGFLLLGRWIWCEALG